MRNPTSYSYRGSGRKNKEAKSPTREEKGVRTLKVGSSATGGKGVGSPERKEKGT